MSADPQRNPPKNERFYEQVNRGRKHQGEDRSAHWPQSWDDQHRCDKLTFTSVLELKPEPEVP